MFKPCPVVILYNGTHIILPSVSIRNERSHTSTYPIRLHGGHRNSGPQYPTSKSKYFRPFIHLSRRTKLRDRLQRPLDDVRFRDALGRLR